ncbi:2-oxo-tetronate isomerase [Halomonas huangheensis]|uniref:Xylose isomerase-like TIM barrel domain-containing protein n=1 Tax=Halomonas huangheensis TaxID=1178482 RepID=W1N843_9GAMM|nr:2-oxo-tetronate isomerase [Halomonas huangheensis]ALM53619.1 hydroxypyruvate isomerase [Halomonas huangheensis]ERL51679.1 hypothetical protein BJB45_10980 [Halomonas huangheensis]
MIKLAANLSMLFTEHEFLDRFSAAAEVGFKGVEYLFPYAFEAQDIRQRLDAHGLKQVLFNLPPGDWDAGERGLASLPGREQEFRDSVEVALRYAEALDCPRLHAMAGLLPEDADDAVYRRHHASYIDNLRYAAEACASAGRTLLIEPINGRDMPGFFLQTQQQARDIVREVGVDSLKVQFDLYHCQIVQGDLMHEMEAQYPQIGHVQIAGVPERHEPDRGEVNYPQLLEHLEGLGYRGWVGCEYRPRAGTVAGLGWASAYGIGGRT